MGSLKTNHRLFQVSFPAQDSLYTKQIGESQCTCVWCSSSRKRNYVIFVINPKTTKSSSGFGIRYMHILQEQLWFASGLTTPESKPKQGQKKMPSQLMAVQRRSKLLMGRSSAGENRWSFIRLEPWSSSSEVKQLQKLTVFWVSFALNGLGLFGTRKLKENSWVKGKLETTICIASGKP